MVHLPDQTAPGSKKDPLLAVFTEGHMTPDPEFVEALMNVVWFQEYSPSDKRRHSEHLPDSVLEANIGRHPDHFIPPRRIVGTNDLQQIQWGARVFWQQIAELLLWKAQQTAFSPDSLREILTTPRPSIIKPPYVNYSVGRDKEHLYMDIDSAGSRPTHEITREIADLRDAIKVKIREALLNVMRDRAQMGEVQRTAEVHRAIQTEVVLHDYIVWLDEIRKQVEDPKDIAKFLELLKKTLKELGIDDLDVDLLSTKDALVFGCGALYVPAEKQKRAKVCIPMSQYGTTQLLEWKEVLERLAHEVAHHLLRTAKPLSNVQSVTEEEKFQDPIVTRGNWGSYFVTRASAYGKTTRELADSGERVSDPMDIADHQMAHTLCTATVLARLEELKFGWRNVSRKASIASLPHQGTIRGKILRWFFGL